MEHLSESLSVSLSTCFCIDNSENNRSRIIKLEYIVEHEKFDIGHCQAKVKVTVRLQNVSPFNGKQTVRSHNLTLVQARRLKLSMYVYQIIIYLSLRTS